MTQGLDTAVPLLSLREVAFTYPGAVPVDALTPTSFEIGVGERVAIVGPSGSGKSTLLQVLGLLATPTAGDYLIEGSSVVGLSEAQRCDVRGALIGFVFQAFHLMASRTVAANVELPLIYSHARSSSTERRELVADALERVGLAHRIDHRANELSGGECQRVAIARALIAAPKLILADEPTGNLDTVNSDRIVNLLHTTADDGVTLIVITHDPAVAARFDRVLSITDGVVTDG